MKYSISIIFSILLNTFLLAQSEQDKKYILNQTNKEALNKFILKYNQNQKKWSDKLAKKRIDSVITGKNGRTMYFSGFDINGNLVYDYDDNLNAAITARVNNIWTGGNSGLNLTGDSIVIGHWEAGGVALYNHQEITGRVTYAESDDISDHATHTATTMIGTGIGPNARGMAQKAGIISYKSDNDEEELAYFALSGGILSNHSYSTGDPEGDIPEYGRYTENASEWDQIMYNAPYLLICKSAGNNRNDPTPNPPDDGFDIMYTVATCKNLITVGAVDDVLNYTGPFSVIQSEFSNWGPTDDWRIKPDITTNGVNLYSAISTSTDAYGIKSGTSMSTPTVTGSVALLQQHYKNTNGVYMKASTVKALIICTADEAGQYDGPDFKSGWGLLNAEKAAQVVSNVGVSSIIKELSLQNDSTYIINNAKTDGSTPVALTIAWTDPPGEPVTGEDNLTPILVNDLDVRILSADSTYSPWVMTPNENKNNFTDGAKRGGNYRDNIEKIEANLPAGNYVIYISHKGILSGGHQDFSLIATGLYEPPPVKQFALNVNANEEQGEIEIFPPGETYDSLSIVAIEAKPKIGWGFNNWDGDISGSENPSTILMNGDKTITANFIDLPNIKPVSNANGDYGAFINQNISFKSDSSYDPDGDINTYLWNFGDGSSSSSANPEHSYNAIDTFLVTLTITDNEGAKDTDTANVFIIPQETHVKPPYNTGFENGSFDQYWFTESDSEYGRIQITSENGPKSGSYHLAMDVSIAGIFTTNQACLKLDLTDITEAYFSFWYKEFDEPHNKDAVYFSDNGGFSYVKVYELTSGNWTYQQVVLDIIELATEKGLNTKGPFIIKLQQYDDYPMTNDGFWFDDINVGLANSTGRKVNNRLEVKLYPNPAYEKLTIEMPTNKTANIKIINMLGSTVKKIKNLNKLDIIDISNLENGIYYIMVEIENDKNIQIQKLIIL